MRSTKSPGAVAARGASEPDQLGRRVILENSFHESIVQVPIWATIIGSDRCEAEGITAQGSAPVLALCRALIEAGYDPDRLLHAHRGGLLALVVRSIGEGGLLSRG